MQLDAERMSRVDTAWLRMDNDVNLMMIVGVWLLSPGVGYAATRDRIAEKLLQYPRFRQKVVHDTLGANWVEDPDFDIQRHVVVSKLPRRRGQSERAALQAYAGHQATVPLDPKHPLWQFELIEHYEGGSAMVVRIHHCIGDGIALTSVVMSITDGGLSPPQRKPHDPSADDEHRDWITDSVIRPFTELAVKGIGMTGSGVSRSLGVLAHPQQPLQGSVDLARAGVQAVSDAAALALMADDSPTLLKGQPCRRKIVAWNEPMPLDEVKAIGKALNCSINDVLLSCVSGAIGRYLRERGDDPAGKEIRAMVPVNLRPLEHAWKLGNHFGLAPLTLPIGIDNPIERVYAVRQRMQQLKGSYQPVLAFTVLQVAGLLNKPMQDMLLGLFSKKTTAVVTNVPGPARALKFCGATLRQSIFWVPMTGNVGLGVSILSYAGGVQFGLIADTALCPQPQEIIDLFGPEFETLLTLTLMLPWNAAA